MTDGGGDHNAVSSFWLPQPDVLTWALYSGGRNMDIMSALDAATDEFGRRLALVSGDAWTHSTPCPDWDVHFLAAHVIGGNRFACQILGGMPAVEAIEQIMSSPQLGDDPHGAWASTCALQAAAFNAHGALERPIDHPLGQISGRQFLDFRVFDITLHAWDLARAVGANEQLSPDLVDVVLNIVENGPPGMGFGIAALGQVPENASAQAKLLDLTGRTPT
ncbi:MAG: hypothetical protein JWL72_4336 [Ilumatobacteraceae bacterium]|nr:hypothetical protein [Ilumatobacteraceae bacterium]